MTTIGPNSVQPERESVEDIVDKVNRVLLSMSTVYLQRPYPCGVIDGRILVSTDPIPASRLQGQNFDIHLHVMTGNLLGVSTGVQGTAVGLVHSEQECDKHSRIQCELRDIDPCTRLFAVDQGGMWSATPGPFQSSEVVFCLGGSSRSASPGSACQSRSTT